MNIVIKDNDLPSDSLGAIDLLGPETDLQRCPYNDLSMHVVYMLCQAYRAHDLAKSNIIICYPEEPWWLTLSRTALVESCHKFMEERKLPLTNLTIITGNFLAHETYDRWLLNTGRPLSDKIEIHTHYTHWDWWLRVKKENYYTTHEKARYFKYLNLNGSHRSHRSDILNHLYENDLFGYGHNSCHFETDQHHGDLHPDLAKELPLSIDHLPPNAHYQDQSHLYDNTYFSIVSETCFSNDEGGITEKSYKTFFYRHPFIMVSSPGTIAVLHKLGFKTFDGLIDESYDNIKDDVDRSTAIKKEIDKLCAMSLEELHEWHHSLNDIYDHNQHLLWSWSCTSRRERPRRSDAGSTNQAWPPKPGR